MFKDRHDAGHRLGRELLRLKHRHPLVLALPRGGVPVGEAVAEVLECPLGLLLARRLGAPQRRDHAIGVVIDGEPPDVVVDEGEVRRLAVPPEWVAAESGRCAHELLRRRHLYLGDRPPPDLARRWLVVVDDGADPESCLVAALGALRRHDPARLVMALPAAPGPMLAALSRAADEVDCLHALPAGQPVGHWYREFHQVHDDQMVALLRRAEARMSNHGG